MNIKLNNLNNNLLKNPIPRIFNISSRDIIYTKLAQNINN